MSESRVFSNASIDNGIYFEAVPWTVSSSSTVTDGHEQHGPRLPPPTPHLSESLTPSSDPGSPPLPPLPHLLLTRRQRLESSASSQCWTGDSLECGSMSQTTTASDYEQPVQSMRRFLLSSHDRMSETRNTSGTCETLC